MFKQLSEQFGDAEQFYKRFQAILADPERLVNLKLELAATSVGEHFIKTTYDLEGDGPLVFSCFERFKAVTEAYQAPHVPNIRAVAVANANEDATQVSATLEQIEDQSVCTVSYTLVLAEV